MGACIEEFLPTISAECEEELAEVSVDTVNTTGLTAFECMLRVVREQDPEGDAQTGVRNYLRNNLLGYPEFVLGAACTVESGPDYNDSDIEDCANCWPADALSMEGIEQAKECTAAYMPSIAAKCKDVMDQLTEEDDIETGKRVFECFLDYIQAVDFKAEGDQVLITDGLGEGPGGELITDGLEEGPGGELITDGLEEGAAGALGPIQQEVLQYLLDNPTEDETFMIGTLCTLEAAPEYDEEQIDACSRCAPDDKESEEGIQETNACIDKYMPNVKAFGCDAESEWDCFYQFIQDKDPTGEAQSEVRKYLAANPHEYPEFVLSSACAVENQPDYDRVEECETCVADADCALEKGEDYLPNVGLICAEQIETGEGELILKCFNEYVSANDNVKVEWE